MSVTRSPMYRTPIGQPDTHAGSSPCGSRSGTRTCRRRPSRAPAYAGSTVPACASGEGVGPVEVTRLVGAGRHAGTGPDTGLRVDQDQPGVGADVRADR